RSWTRASASASSARCRRTPATRVAPPTRSGSRGGRWSAASRGSASSGRATSLERRRPPEASAARQEQPVGRVSALVPMAVAERREELAEGAVLTGRDLEADEHAAVVRPLVAVVEQGDVPVGRHAGEEAHERARALGELEAVEALVGGERRAAPHE